MVGRAARCTCRTAGRRREQVFYTWRYTLNSATSAAIANWRGSQVLTARLKRFDERLRIRGQFARRVRRDSVIIVSTLSSAMKMLGCGAAERDYSCGLSPMAVY